MTTICCCSVAKLCPTVRDPMDWSIPGFPVPHHLPEFVQIHVHLIGDAFQPSHPLSPSSSAVNLSQHQHLFPVSQLFTSGGQSTGASALASVLPKSIQGWFPLRLTGLISLLSKDSQESSAAPQFKRNSAFFVVQLSQPHMTTGNTIALTRRSLVGKVMSLLLNTLSRFIVAFLQRSNHLF